MSLQNLRVRTSWILEKEGEQDPAAGNTEDKACSEDFFGFLQNSEDKYLKREKKTHLR